MRGGVRGKDERINRCVVGVVDDVGGEVAVHEAVLEFEMGVQRLHACLDPLVQVVPQELLGRLLHSY